MLFGASLGLFLGIFLLLTASQTFYDLKKLLHDAEGAENYLVINKKVNIFNTLGAKAAFTSDELAEIKGKPFIKAVFPFTANQFSVSASSPTLGFYTELFFESVPDECLDVLPSNWDWQPGQTMLPIILSKDYLALYNFGFAPSQGLPQFTPGTIKKVSLDISIGSANQKKIFTGKVVGFTERYNSILVPATFMSWANTRFGNEEEPPSRLILQIENGQTPELLTFLGDHNYETAASNSFAAQFAGLFDLSLAGIGILALLIFLLAFFIFQLNVQLIVNKASPHIMLLMQIGYSRRQISKGLLKKSFSQFAFILVMAVLFVLASRFFFLKWLINSGFDLPFTPHPMTMLLLCMLVFIFIFFNIRTTKVTIRSAATYG